jgi:hypothetical protein
VEAGKAVVVKQGMAAAPVVAMTTAAASLTLDTRGKGLARCCLHIDNKVITEHNE